MASRKKIKAKIIARENRDTLKAERIAQQVERVVYEIMNDFFSNEYNSDNTNFLISLKSLPSRLESIQRQELERLSGLYADKLDYIKSDFKPFTTGTIITSTEIAITNAMIEANLAEIKSIIDDYTTKVIRGAVLAQVSGKKFDYPKIHNDEADSFINKVFTNTITSADGFERGLSIKKATDLDLKYFIYEGGLIKTSRPFCVEKAGKIFTMQDLKSWDNGQKLPVIPYLGGYNCRHHINWISDELAKSLGAK